MAFDPKDGGYASRKLIYAAGTSIAIILCGLMAALWGGFGANLDVVVGGLLGALGLYLGGNVTTKWASTRMKAKKAAVVPAKDPSSAPVEQLPPE